MGASMRGPLKCRHEAVADTYSYNDSYSYFDADADTHANTESYTDPAASP